MVQQYYNLEQAARLLGMTPEQLNRLREQGQVRGFADRGTWKFRHQDIEELSQKRGRGDKPLEEPSPADEDVDQVLLSEQELGGSDSSSAISGTVIGMGSSDSSASDSDVRLIPRESAQRLGDSDVNLVAGEETQPVTDSDVRLADEGSDQPTSDSDVRLAGRSVEGSDSDVRLRGTSPAQRRPSAPEQKTDFEMASEAAMTSPGATKEAADTDSGESSFELADSDISISPADSGISLTSPTDSGISLEQPASLPTATPTSPQGGELLETDFEVPLLAESGALVDATDVQDSDFELGESAPTTEESGSHVIALGDEEADESSATIVGQSSELIEELGEPMAELEEVEELVEGEVVSVSEFERPPRPELLTAQEREWGPMVFSGLTAATVLLLLVSFMMFDLVRNLWSWSQPHPLNSVLMDALISLFG